MRKEYQYNYGHWLRKISWPIKKARAQKGWC
jgi:hypothetical protein